MYLLTYCTIESETACMYAEADAAGTSTFVGENHRRVGRCVCGTLQNVPRSILEWIRSCMERMSLCNMPHVNVESSAFTGPE